VRPLGLLVRHFGTRYPVALLETLRTAARISLVATRGRVAHKNPIDSARLSLL